MREITSALTLVHFHHVNSYHFDAVGPLAENFCNCPESMALEYYEQKVMGKVVDQFGRTILIDEDGMKSLYKEHGSGKHIVAPENYEAFRGKRLPWIRHVLQYSKAVYAVDETVQGKFRRTYIYTAIASIPVQPKPAVAHFIVVVSEDGNKNLKFVTAYAINQSNRFLKCIEPGQPMGERSAKLIVPPIWLVPLYYCYSSPDTLLSRSSPFRWWVRLSHGPADGFRV